MLTVARRLAVVLAVSLLVFFVGCDTVDPGGESVVLFANVEDQLGDDLRFSFDSDNAQVGQALTLQAAQRIDLGAFLNQQGFSKAEVLSAQVESAAIGVRFPLGVSVDFMDDVTLQLTASGLSATTVASRSTFPSSRDVNLNVQADQPIASFVTRPDFGVQLLLTPGSLQPGEDYELTVTMRVRIEVEGV